MLQGAAADAGLLGGASARVREAAQGAGAGEASEEDAEYAARALRLEVHDKVAASLCCVWCALHM